MNKSDNLSTTHMRVTNVDLDWAYRRFDGRFTFDKKPHKLWTDLYTHVQPHTIGDKVKLVFDRAQEEVDSVEVVVLPNDTSAPWFHDYCTLAAEIHFGYQLKWMVVVFKSELALYAFGNHPKVCTLKRRERNESS
jgi:hypothetical protein